MSTTYDAQELAELDAHHERRRESMEDDEDNGRHLRCHDGRCGALDCPRCRPGTWRECGGEDDGTTREGHNEPSSPTESA